MSWGALSPEAQKAKDEAAIRARIRWRRMKAGPYLAADGFLLIVPSEPGYYRARAVEFWKQEGFYWSEHHQGWVRDTRRTRWSPAKWLQAARAHYYRFWPDWAPPAEEPVPPA